MGKRKSNTNIDLDDIAKKIKKLQKKLSRSVERRSSSSNEDEIEDDEQYHDNYYVEYSENNDYNYQPENLEPIAENDILPSTSTNVPTVSSVVVVPPTPTVPSTTLQGPTTCNPTDNNDLMAIIDETSAADTLIPTATESTQISAELLEILGLYPESEVKFGKEIQNDLAVRIRHIISNGIQKEVRKELLDRYLPPANCTTIEAPLLNPELCAAVSELVIKRDKGIEIKQKQLRSVIACIAEVITNLLAKENKDTATLKTLMDACRMLCDCQYSDSVLRRNFILSNIKKETKDQLQKTSIDKFLFGTELAEALKTAKTISKTGADLKAPTTSTQPKPFLDRSKGPARNNNLNWRAPPAIRGRGRAPPRSREPLVRNRLPQSQAQYSRPFSAHNRPPPPPDPLPGSVHI